MFKPLARFVGGVITELFVGAKRPARARAGQGAALPRLEALEDRAVPTGGGAVADQYFWHNLQGNNSFTDGRNWTDQAVGGTPYAQNNAPNDASDHLFFANSQTSANCVYNGGALTVGSVTFTTYSGTWESTISATGLTVSGGLTFAGSNGHLKVVGAAGILGVNGAFNVNDGATGQLDMDQVWLAGGGTNEGDMCLNVGAINFNSNYTLKDRFQMLRTNSTLNNLSGKTLTITPESSGAKIISPGDLSDAPVFMNYGMVTVNSGNAYFTEVPFYNAGSLRVRDGAYMEVYLDSYATNYAFVQGAPTASTDIEEGGTIWADNNDSVNDAWIQYGLLKTTDVLNKDTATFNAGNLYIGFVSGYGTNYATVNVTAGSATPGILKNNAGNITLYNSAWIKMSVGHNEFQTRINDQIITPYNFTRNGTLDVETLPDLLAQNTSWTLITTQADGVLGAWSVLWVDGAPNTSWAPWDVTGLGQTGVRYTP